MPDFKAAYTAKVATDGWVKDYVQDRVPVLSIDSFGYNARFNIIPAQVGTLQTVIIQTQADSDFLCTGISGSLTGAVQVVPSLLTQITDLSSGKTLFNKPQLLRQVAGGFGMPFVLPTPKIIHPNTNVQIDATANEGFAAGTILFITLWGVRVYYAG